MQDTCSQQRTFALSQPLVNVSDHNEGYEIEQLDNFLLDLNLEFEDKLTDFDKNGNMIQVLIEPLLSFKAECKGDQ